MITGLSTEVRNIGTSITYLTLTGVLNEDNGLEEHLDVIKNPIVLIDSKGVIRMNSCGVRDWIFWIQKLEGLKKEIFLVECSPALITQTNLIENFTGQATIINFYAPYYCTYCNEETRKLFYVKDLLNQEAFNPPNTMCPSCNKEVEYDEMDLPFFTFLSELKFRPVPNELFKVLEQNTSSSS